MKNNRYINGLFTVVLVAAGFLAVACEDEPDKYEIAGGSPTLKYIRVPDPVAADSLLTGAYMANTICLVGENMRSVYELYFNDQKAILNTSYITDNTLIVDVPKEIPAVVTDKIYMVTKSRDTVDYDFKVLVPAPTVNSMSCEYAKPGSEVTLYGDYFIDDPNVPLAITMEGNIAVTNITNISKTAIRFILPDNAPEGYINVKSIYGTSRSKFRYHDSRGLMFDFDGITGLTNHGWHNREITTDANAVSGNYVQLGDGSTAMSEDGGWNDALFSFEYWCGDWSTPEKFEGTDIKLNDLVDFTDFQNMSIKFEMCIPKNNAWSAGAMQVIFAGTDLVTLQTANNDFFHAPANPGWPRALYRPWIGTGSFDTNDEWVTVTLPIASTFVYDETGAAATQALKETSFSSLTIFVYGGGINGKECTPIIKLDNIRAVPND
ncbi:glycan-binding surface protein [Bacteroides sp.]|uniref:glycan-binding surface protein n=1 Tax=Bacteroides sp. TaxID=29523 RepID=UPI0025880520|nr:glycan-binding surface protein [Bacteroides sp.]